MAGNASVLESAGLRPVRIDYQNVAGILPWIVAGRVLRRAQAVSGPEGRLFDAAVPVLQPLERILPPPIGLSSSAACEVAA